jgi:hypothetical protein
MLFYYDILVWLVAIGAAITLIEAMTLALLSRTETWWQVRTNRIVVSLDISTGLGFFNLFSFTTLDRAQLYGLPVSRLSQFSLR